jgi:hypothetical protein
MVLGAPLSNVSVVVGVTVNIHFQDVFIIVIVVISSTGTQQSIHSRVTIRINTEISVQHFIEICAHTALACLIPAVTARVAVVQVVRPPKSVFPAYAIATIHIGRFDEGKKAVGSVREGERNHATLLCIVLAHAGVIPHVQHLAAKVMMSVMAVVVRKVKSECGAGQPARGVEVRAREELESEHPACRQ